MKPSTKVLATTTGFLEVSLGLASLQKYNILGMTNNPDVIQSNSKSHFHPAYGPWAAMKAYIKLTMPFLSYDIKSDHIIVTEFRIREGDTTRCVPKAEAVSRAICGEDVRVRQYYIHLHTDKELKSMGVSLSDVKPYMLDNNGAIQAPTIRSTGIF